MAITTKQIFKGKNYRVQLTVIDLTGKGVSESIRKDNPTYMVYVLPIDAHPYTAFCKGGQVYYGSNFQLAIEQVKAWVGQEVEIPKKYEKYKYLELD